MRWAPLASIAALVLLAPSALAAWGLPDPVNTRMETIESIYLQLLGLGAIVFVVVFGWLTYNLVKYRPGGEGEPSNEEHRGSLKAELVWTLIPILIVAWVGFISFQGFAEIRAEPEEPAAEIRMEGFQWFWQASYGEDVSLSQQPGQQGSLEGEEAFLIPAGEPVTFNVTSGDVIHSFWVPELGVKIDAMPDRSKEVTVTAPEGEYLIQCAEMCGNPGHAYMNAKLHAVPQDEYDEWIQQKEAEAAREGLGATVEVSITDEGLDPSELTGIAGVPTTVQVSNQVDETRSLEIEGVENGTTGDIAPGENATLNLTLESGEYQVVSQGDEATLTVREAETVNVELDEWAVRGDRTEFEAGEVYLIQVENVGNSPHNLFVGQPEEEDSSDEVLWNSPDLSPGESATIVMEPTQDQVGEWTWWCDIPGHYSQGMRGDIEIVG